MIILYTATRSTEPMWSVSSNLSSDILLLWKFAWFFLFILHCYDGIFNCVYDLCMFWTTMFSYRLIDKVWLLYKKITNSVWVILKLYSQLPTEFTVPHISFFMMISLSSSNQFVYLSFANFNLFWESIKFYRLHELKELIISLNIAPRILTKI